MAKPTAKKWGTLKAAVKVFRDMRKQEKDLKKSISDTQVELIQALRIADPEGRGLVFDPSDSSKGTVFVQQNKASEFWLVEDIIEWLKKPENKALWMSCTSRVFDVQKFEAEVANGNISTKQAKKFKGTGTDPAPFLRFGKADENSIK